MLFIKQVLPFIEYESYQWNIIQFISICSNYGHCTVHADLTRRHTEDNMTDIPGLKKTNHLYQSYELSRT